MNKNRQIPSGGPLKIKEIDVHFAAEVKKRSGVEFARCYHCRCCAGGCPFYDAMDYGPNGVIRLIQLGLRKMALDCTTIWICVGCHTCTIQCPMAIDLSAVMDAVSQIALKENAVLAEPDIFNFHAEVINTIKRYGRTHKLEIMLRYKLQKRNWFQDLDVGLRMMAKRKLDLTPSKVKDINEIKKLFR